MQIPGKELFGEELVRPEPNLIEVRENAMAESGDTPISVTLADLNNDGNLDIAAVNAISKDVSLLFGDGSCNGCVQCGLCRGIRRCSFCVVGVRIGGFFWPLIISQTFDYIQYTCSD